MKKQGKYVKPKYAAKAKKSGNWKIYVIIFLCICLLIGSLGVLGFFFLRSKYNKVKQAEFEEKALTAEEAAELEKLTGNIGGEGNEVDKLISIFETEAPTDQFETEPQTLSTEELPLDDESRWGKSGKIVNILLVGQDSREGEVHKLADTIMMFTLNKETKKLTVTSFFRDSYVKMPDNYRGHSLGWNRINTSYALGYGWFGDAGAMELLNLTLKNNYGIEADGTVEVSFDTFKKVIDTIGGVDIELHDDELTYMNGEAERYHKKGFKDGLNHLNGTKALWYARMRHSNGQDSDVKRSARQRLIIDKVLEKFKSMSIFELNKLLDEILPMIITDITADDMMMYTRELLPYVFDVEMISNQCPAEKTFWGEMVDLPDGPGGVLKIDFNVNRKRMMEICMGVS